MLGVLAGLAVGVAYKQHHPLAFAVTTRAAIARGVFGNIGLMTLFELVAFLSPRRPFLLYAILRFIKYMLVPIYIIHIGPYLFALAGI